MYAPADNGTNCETKLFNESLEYSTPIEGYEVFTKARCHNSS